MFDQNSRLTQQYSTWGDKLLQHLDVLADLQQKRKIRPITVQISLTETCDSRCSFCSVAHRPKNQKISWDQLVQVLVSFKTLGAKSIELTGGGNPLLWFDDSDTNTDEKRNINDVIKLASDLGFKIGIITNSHKLYVLKPQFFKSISWIRISLAKLDEGKKPEDFNFAGFPIHKLSFSYIIHEQTTPETIQQIAKLVEIYPEIKFVRLAGDCLDPNSQEKAKQKFQTIIQEVDRWEKFFLKDIGINNRPFNDGCYVGGIRPYIAPSPEESKPYQVYICTSHVLNQQNYDLDYSLGNVWEILEIWERLNKCLSTIRRPYWIKSNTGKNWCSTCPHCFYHNNNQLIHSVVTPLPDKDFA